MAWQVRCVEPPLSVASNIAEGAARGTETDFRRYLRIASASAGELETQVFISSDVGLMGEETVSSIAALIEHIRRMLYSLERSFR